MTEGQSRRPEVANSYECMSVGHFGLPSCGPGIGTSHIDSLASQYIIAGRLEDDGIFTNIARLLSHQLLELPFTLE